MGFYNAVLTVPAGTLITAPASLEIQPSHRWIEYVSINFPDRCALQVGAQVYWQATRIAPLVGGGQGGVSDWIRANGKVIEWTENPPYDLGPAPHSLFLKAYNTDNLYPHTLDFHFVISNLDPRIAQAAAEARARTN